MSVAYYSQERDAAKLLCPECGEPILVSEYREVGLCTECGEEHPLSSYPVEGGILN